MLVGFSRAEVWQSFVFRVLACLKMPTWEENFCTQTGKTLDDFCKQISEKVIISFSVAQDELRLKNLFVEFISLVLFSCTVKPRFNEVPRDWRNWFVISRVRYFEFLFHTLHY